eukprot:GGOE01012515.1.p1 GENE.GGOE01012515.1~~GGOE01012515.1.p1  ORF type:complete len:157 (+),score=3.86 GGOE01012515.1:203-673(+)
MGIRLSNTMRVTYISNLQAHRGWAGEKAKGYRNRIASRPTAAALRRARLGRSPWRVAFNLVGRRLTSGALGGMISPLGVSDRTCTSGAHHLCQRTLLLNARDKVTSPPLKRRGKGIGQLSLNYGGEGGVGARRTAWSPNPLSSLHTNALWVAMDGQ